MFSTIAGFNKCVFRMPFPWPVWLMALMSVNMIGPLFFLEYIEGQVVLGVFAISAGLMIYLYARLGFTRILGLGHLPWLALVPWLWSRYALVPPGEWLGHWILAVIVMNGISLVLDAVDVVRYLRGDTQPTVPVDKNGEHAEQRRGVAP